MADQTLFRETMICAKQGKHAKLPASIVADDSSRERKRSPPMVELDNAISSGFSRLAKTPCSPGWFLQRSKAWNDAVIDPTS
jgi:hypothetical protein